MARIRTIKPEFPHSQSMGRVSREARLLFVMLFTIVDDEGRARAAPRMLASLLFPYDDDVRERLAGWLGELERENCVALYEAEGNAYLRIANWLAHQRIDKPSKSKLPPPPDGVAEPSAKTREASPREGTGEEENGRDGKRSILSDVPSDLCDFCNSPSGLRSFAFGAPALADAPASAATPLGSLGREPRPAASAPHTGEAGLAKTRDDFAAFWREYPTDALMSKKRAFEQWQKLSPPEREAAKGAIPAFRDYCRKHPSYRPVHAERFLSEKRFEGFASAPAPSQAEIEANKDRADRLMRRGKYAVSFT